jgi:glycosyltransferase involved in cell wall biosynthesis
MKLSVIVPVYNEVSTIQPILARVRNVPIDKEIIVVDGNSTDGTRDLLALEEKQPDTRVIYKPHRCGRGLALKIGMAEAKGEIILFQDADLELDPAEYPLMLKPFENPEVKVVFGSRFIGKPNGKANAWQRIGNRFISTMVNLLFGSSLTDAETGYQIFRKEALNGITIHGNEFDFTIELTAKLLKKGYKIVEVPISFTPRTRKEGKKLHFLDGIDSLWTLLKYRIKD